MTRTLSLAAAALAALPLAAVAQGAGPAPAGYYVATPVATPARPLLITNGIVWKWSDTAFVAAQGPLRDAITCQMIAQTTGKLSAFSAAGRSFDAPALEKCNAHAR